MTQTSGMPEANFPADGVDSKVDSYVYSGGNEEGDGVEDIWSVFQ